MRVLVCGGRDYNDRDHIWNELCRLDIERGPFTCVIHGAARGADYEAMIWAQCERNNGRKVLHAPFVAEWDKYGRAAGSIRNARMLREGRPDLVIAFPGGKGTANMIGQAKAKGVEVIQIKGREAG
jgi:hypothetical protein